MSSRRIQAVVHGRVQGVFFRDYTRRKAEELGVSGWVRNRPDGTVEADIEGAPDDVAAMVEWLHEGSPHSAVTSVEVGEEEPRGGEGFVIRY